MRRRRNNVGRVSPVAVMAALAAGLFYPAGGWSQQAGTGQGGAAAPDQQAQPTQPAQPKAGGIGGAWSAFPTTNTLALPAALQRKDLGLAVDQPPPFQAQFGLGAQQSWTDNVYTTAKNTKSDEFATVDPTLSVTAKTKRLDIGLNYGAQYDRYYSQTRMDKLSHNGTATLTGEVIDQQLFVDTRASISEQAANPTAPSAAGTRTTAGNSVQVTTYQAGPRLQERIGDWGIAQISASHAQSLTENASPLATTQTSTSTTAIANGIGNSSTDHGRFEMRSGQSFGQLLWDYSSDFTVTKQSTGPLNKQTHQLGTEYRLNTDWGLLTSLGDDLTHGQQVSSKSSGAFFLGGLHWTPSPNTDIKGGAGWRYGQSNISTLFDHKLGPRTTVRFSHDEGVTTDALNSLDSLNAMTRDEQGNFVNPFTGLAASPGSSFFQRSNAVFRQKVTSAVLAHQELRDNFTLTANLAEQNVVSSPQTLVTTLTGLPLASSSTTATVSFVWTHQMNPMMSANAALNAGDVLTASLPSAKTKTAGATAGLSYSLSKTMSAVGNYTLRDNWQPATGVPVTATAVQTGSIKENLIYFGLKKQF